MKKNRQFCFRLLILISLLIPSILGSSSIIALEKMTDEKEQQTTFLLENQLMQQENGKLYTTVPSNYIHSSIHDKFGRIDTRDNQIIHRSQCTHCKYRYLLIQWRSRVWLVWETSKWRDCTMHRARSST
ncbi:Cna B domain-containing protein [Enterococcus durans]|uniref:Cna B domain-containing protein n=1 Tax=Enterococcus durans TaxID=53345 RepID=A0A377KK68_9ENTE|nr:Cna B domain-containing protein [Enterococcus durans]